MSEKITISKETFLTLVEIFQTTNITLKAGGAKKVYEAVEEIKTIIDTFETSPQ